MSSILHICKDIKTRKLKVQYLFGSTTKKPSSLYVFKLVRAPLNVLLRGF